MTATVPDDILRLMTAAMLDPKIATDAKVLDGTVLPRSASIGHDVRKEVLLRALTVAEVRGWRFCFSYPTEKPPYWAANELPYAITHHTMNDH